MFLGKQPTLSAYLVDYKSTNHLAVMSSFICKRFVPYDKKKCYYFYMLFSNNITALFNLIRGFDFLLVFKKLFH